MKPVQDPAPRGLSIRLLGTVEVGWCGRAIEAFPTRHAELLFAFLALNGSRMHSRDALTGIFWGEMPDESARKRLRTALWRVRSTLGTKVPVDDYLSVYRDRVGFMPRGPYRVDVHDFEDGVRTALSAQSSSHGAAKLADLENAIALYRGDLLEGEYDDWCLSERDRFKVLYIDAIEHMMRCHSGVGAWGQALDCGNRILEEDPLREQVHREVMALYYLAGDRPRALRQFSACEQTLRAELGVGPMRRTQQVRDALESEDEAALVEVVAAGGARSW